MVKIDRILWSLSLYRFNRFSYCVEVFLLLDLLPLKFIFEKTTHLLLYFERHAGVDSALNIFLRLLKLIRDFIFLCIRYLVGVELT